VRETHRSAFGATLASSSRPMPPADAAATVFRMDSPEDAGAPSGAREPPADWRPWTFRRPGVCGAGCGLPLLAGEQGFWNSVTKEVRHAACPPWAATKAGQERSPWTGLPEPKNEWQRLVAYCRACVLRESLSEPPRYEAFGDAWAVVTQGSEQILAGTSRSLPVSDALVRVIAPLTAGSPSSPAVRRAVGRPPGSGLHEAGDAAGTAALGAAHAAEAAAAVQDQHAARAELAYGCPLVVCRDDARQIRCAPLLIATAAPPARGAREIVVSSESAALNIAVADPRYQPDADPTLLRLIADEPLPLGDLEALAERLTAIATDAGLAIREPLDATALCGGRPPGQPGVYNRAVLLRREPSQMTRSLLADLRDLFWKPRSEWERTAASRLLGGTSRQRSRPLPVVSINRLNVSQEKALCQAVASPVSVITGPPGTGKSQFVAALVATARDRDMTVLVASTNNAAVDEAVDRSVSAHAATILRTGNAEYRKRLTVVLEGICADADREADHVGARARHRAASERREQVRAALGRRAEELRRLDEAAREVARLAEELWSGPPPAIARDDPRDVHERAARLRRGWWRWWARRKLVRALDLRPSRPLSDTLDALQAWASVEIVLSAALESLDVAAGSREWQAWQERDDAWREASRALVAAVSQEAVHGARERLDRLLRAYREGDRDASALASFLDVLPAWATSAMSVRPNFACKPAIFDLLVVDEASQCTLPAILPLAFRAKQVVVVGDPNQLPPVVTVPSAELEQLPGSAGLDEEALAERRQLYGVDSCYGAFRHLVDNELLLDEHYRCHPDVAAYCDELFYKGRLHVLTDTTRWPTTPVQGLSWMHVEGESEPGATSSRINAAEADAVVRWVSTAAPGLRSSGAELGVVTPFTAQAHLIERKLRAALDVDTRTALRLRVGTAHRFQGGERDVMLFSTVVARGVPSGTIEWLEKNRYLINVAVSRARAALIVVGDAHELDGLGAATLVALRDHARAHAEVEVTLNHVEKTLLANLPVDVDVRVGERVASHRTQLSLRTDQGTTVVLAVDAGQGDAAQRLRTLLLDQIMISAGAEVIRVPAWLCRHDPDEAARTVLRGIGALGARRSA
jgi:hypothetical protein